MADFSHYILCMTNHAWLRVKFSKQTVKSWAFCIFLSLLIPLSWRISGIFDATEKKNDNAKNAICAHNSCRNWAKRNEFSRLRREEISWEKKAGKKERKEFTPITKQKMILYHLLVLIHFRFSCLLLISSFFLSLFGLLIFFSLLLSMRCCWSSWCERFVRRYINMQLMAEKSRHNAINLFAQRNWTARIRKTSMCDVK